jgi:hypothetical protein
MVDMLEFLNKNSGALSALFSGVVTVATVVYAWLTAKLVEETRQMRMVQTEPRVQVTYRVSEEWINFLDVSIRNIGLGPAYDLRFAIRGETDLPGTKELLAKLDSLFAFKNGVAYLGPGEQYLSFWTSLLEGDGTKVESRIIVDCTYCSSTGAVYQHPCVIDLSELKGSGRLGEPPLQKIAKSLDAVAKDLHAMKSTDGRLKANVYSSADREDANAQMQERLRAMREERKQEAGQ